MADFSSADSSWLNLIQSLGVIGTVLLGVAALNRDARSREEQNLLTLKKEHRELWGGASKKPELRRIFEMNIDVLAEPPTVEEEEFLNLAFIHFQTGWSLAKSGSLITRSEMKDDLRSFLAYPLRRAIWEKTCSGRNKQFVRFVTQALQ